MTITITNEARDKLLQTILDNVADWAGDLIPDNPTVEDAYDVNLAFVNVMAHSLGISVAKTVALSGFIEPNASLELLSRLPNVFDVVRTVAIESLDDSIADLTDIIKGDDDG